MRRKRAQAREALLAGLSARINRYNDTGDPSAVLDPVALDEAAALLDVAGEPGTDFDVCFTVGGLYWCRWVVLGNGQESEDLLRAADLLVHVYRERPESVPRTLAAIFDDIGYTPQALRAGPAAGEWVTQGVELLAEHQRTRDRATLERAISLLRQAMDVTSPHHEYYPDRAWALGLALRERFRTTAEVADGDAAIRLLADVAARPGADAERVGVLAATLLLRYQVTADAATLDEAIAVARQAIGAAGREQPLTSLLTNLGLALRYRFARTHDPADLDDAVRVLARAQGEPDSGEARAVLDTAGVLCGVLMDWLVHAAKARWLPEVVALVRDATAALPADHPDRTGHLMDLGVGLLVATEDIPDPDAATVSAALLQAALPTAPADRRGHVLKHLTVAWQRRFERTGEFADLAGCVAAGRETLTVADPEDDNRFEFMDNLATLLSAMWARTHDTALLDEAVELQRGAVAGIPPSRPDAVIVVHNLGARLSERFQVSARQADLTEGIALLRRAVELVPPTHPERPRLMRNLAKSLQLAYEHTGEFAALDEARALTRKIAAEEGTA
jgi:hypothetical protein